MAKKIQFIVNPVAGQGSGTRVLPEIERLAHENSLDYKIDKTEYPAHAIELARRAASSGTELVVAVGGDGTSNEVLNGLMAAWKLGYASSKMGILGIGRGNDFAYGHGIPRGLSHGFDVILSGIPQPMDVGQVIGGDYPQGRYFGNGVGIGFDAVVGFEAAKLTHLHGFLNYIVAAMRTIFLFFNAPLLQIEYDEKTITQPSLLVSIMNGRRMGGGFMMAPHASTNDGLLDICIAGQFSRLGILAMIPRFIQGTQASHPEIKTVRAVEVHVTAIKGVLPAHADGETICTAGNDLIVELNRQPLEILTSSSHP